MLLFDRSCGCAKAFRLVPDKYLQKEDDKIEEVVCEEGPPVKKPKSNAPSVTWVRRDVTEEHSKNPTGNEDYEKNFGKAAAPLVQMLDEFDELKKALPSRFYFDNLLTGISLLTQLKQLGYGATGTIRENRIPKQYEVLLARWKDNSVVTVTSTWHCAKPPVNVLRYCITQKKRIRVAMPSQISKYNKNMGETDRMDENISYYRVGFRGKKWWWRPLFTWLLDAAMNNAWVLS
ncbi:hypothetical protein ILUMI_27386 [Ignelater luminosus]|uniref:PiggyBac transposable element-derived protein domain-containing protein n=1 Tax=Ignelater luminosus TaxID=2038154 RepID=A0A8K0FWY2_IGNLU|nr:hypothetical protein ILUMI_27386 [Ignelater luminosus]